jgi:hypothetical protein
MGAPWAGRTSRGDWLDVARRVLGLEDELADQVLFAFSYVVFGLVLASSPGAYVILRRSVSSPEQTKTIVNSAISTLLSLVVAFAVFILDGPLFLVGSLILSVAVAGLAGNDRIRAFLLALAAIGAAGTLLWWNFDESHKLTVKTEYIFYYFAAAIIIVLISYVRNARSPGRDAIILAIVFAFVLQHSLNMSPMFDDYIYTAVRHHWGAYIGPSETVLSGARLLYDVPAQYGFGPTLLIASACGNNCWVGMYWISTIASILYAILIIGSASVLMRKDGNIWVYAIAILSAGAACMLWTSYPPQLGGPWSFPSTGGLRFIPLAALILFVLWSESRPSERRPSRFFGYLIWGFGALWAPESAFYLSLVWWPYLIWRAGGVSADPLRGAVFAVLEIIAATCALAIAFIGVFFLLYGVSPSLDLYLAYVVNPTGPLPPNPLGSVWFFIFAMVAGISAAALLLKGKDAGRGVASLFVCLLALFAVFSYYVGRSHDNNILNIMPFLVLVLAAVESFAPIPALSRSARVALASSLALVLFFGWSAWRQTSLVDYANSAPAASMSYIRGQTAEESGAAAIPTLQSVADPTPASTPAIPMPGGAPGAPGVPGQLVQKSRIDGASPSDAARAVFYIASERHEPLIKVDDGLDIAPIGPRAWAAIHDPIDFYFLPDALLAKMIDRTMRRIKSPGWLVIGKHVDNVAETLRWQRLLEASYNKVEEKDFGAYHAIRYEPKLP